MSIITVTLTLISSVIIIIIINGLQLTDDSETRLKNESAANDPNVVLTFIPFQDDNTERLVEMC